MAELDLNSLSPEERRRLLEQVDQVRLNIAQEQLLQTYNPNMQAYEFKKPENFGQAVGNIFKNRVVNPLQETFGYREPLSDVVDKYRISGYQADENQRVVDELSRRRVMNNLANAGVPIEKLQGLDHEKLQNVYTNLQSTPVRGPYGEWFTVNFLDRKWTPVATPSSGLQEYFFDNPDARPRLEDPNARPGLENPNARPGLNEQQIALANGPVESFSEYQRRLENEKAQSQAEIERTTSRLGKLDERAINRIDAILDPVYSAMSNIGNQRASLGQLTQILDAGAETGATAPMLAMARSLGLSLGLDVADPTPEQMFGAISKQIALPLVKDLGSNPTDTDLQMILDSAPSLSQTKEGNRLLIQTIQLKLERDELLARAVMQYEDEYASLLAENPGAYRRGLDRAVIELQNSPEYKGKMALKLRADFAAQRGEQTDPQRVAREY